MITAGPAQFLSGSDERDRRGAGPILDRCRVARVQESRHEVTHAPSTRLATMRFAASTCQIHRRYARGPGRQAQQRKLPYGRHPS
jgi:hypothetical protein